MPLTYPSMRTMEMSQKMSVIPVKLCYSSTATGGVVANMLLKTTLVY